MQQCSKVLNMLHMFKNEELEIQLPKFERLYVL